MNESLPTQTAIEPMALLSTKPRGARRLLLWTIVGVLVLCAVLQVSMAWDELRSGGMDFQQDYIAAQRLRAGGDIFAPIQPAEVAALGIDETLGFGMRLNVHPPLTALLLAPLTAFSFSAATLFWTIASVVLLFGTVYLLLSELGPRLSRLWKLVIALLTLNWYPVWLHLHLGQFTILLFALIVGAWYCLRRERDTLAGGLLAAAVVLKIFPVVLLGYAVIRRRWRMLWSAAAVALALVLVQTTISPHQWPDYFTQVAPKNAATWMNSPRNASLASVGMRLFVGNDEVKPVFDWPAAELPTRATLYTIALAGVALVLWHRRTPDLTGEYSLLLATMVLLSPLSWEHSFIFLLLPLGVVWQRLRTHAGTLRRAPMLFALVSIAVSFLPSELILLAIKRDYWPERMPGWVGLFAPGVVVVICGFMAIVATMWREPIETADRS